MQSHDGRLSRSPSDWGASQLRFIVKLKAPIQILIYISYVVNRKLKIQYSCL